MTCSNCAQRPQVCQRTAQADSSSFCEKTFNDDPLGYLVETILATEEDWGQLPGLAPLFLREALGALEEVVS
jgi:hypothetical protein